MKSWKICLIAAITFGVAQFSNAQWEQTHMPYATMVRSLFATDKYIYMGDDHNIFLSADSGKSWAVSELAGRGSFGSILLRGQNVLAIQAGGNIRKSTYYGYSFSNTWRVFGGAKSLAFLSGTTDYVFVNTGNGVYRTKDDGENWDPAPDSGLTDKNVLNLAVIGGSLIAHSRDSGFFLSHDRAAYWQKINSGLPIDSTGKIVAGVLIPVPGGRGAYFSSAQGVFILNGINNQYQWANANLKIPGATINCALWAEKYVGGRLESKAFFGTDSGLFMLPPLPLRELKAISLGPDTKKISALVQQGDYIYAGTETGMYRVAYSDSNWETVSNGNVVSLRTGKTALFAGTKVGVNKAGTDGKGWTYSKKGPTDIMAMATNGDTVMVAGNGREFNVSGDFGKTWELRKDFGIVTSVYTDMLVRDSCIFLSENHFGGITRSCDGGRRWSDINNGLVAIRSSYNVNVPCIGAADADLFISSSSNSFSQGVDPVNWSGFYRSKDNGASWVKSDSGITGQVRAYAFDGTTHYAGTDNSGIFYSNDGGYIWKKPGSSVIRNITGLISVGDFVVASSLSGVHASRDKGVSWNSILLGLQNKRVNTLAANDTYLFAGTNGSGVYRLPISTLREIVIPTQTRKIPLPDKFKLAVSRGVVVLSMRLEVPSLVSAHIYSVGGTKVATVSNKDYPTGKHELMWNSSNLPDGCFLLRVGINSQYWTGIFVNSK